MKRLVPAVLIVLSVLSGRGAWAAEDNPAGAPAVWPRPIPDSPLRYFVLGDQLEFRANDGDDLLRWDAEGWVGGDYNRLWLKTEGERRTSGPSGGDAEVQLLYGRAIAPFWDLQIGVRQDVQFGSGPDRERTFAAIGVEGLAPYWFELTPTLFISDAGDVSARLTGTYDLLLTQRLVLQPRLELNAAVQDARRFGVRSGFNDIELGLRLRYEIRREFAPYIGVNWLRKLGNTADLAREEGDDVDALGFVVGLRLWF